MLKIKNRGWDPIVPPVSVSMLYNLSCFRHMDNVVVNQKEFDFTRRELWKDRKVLAKALLALGIKKGDIITVATGRSMYDNILIFLAANRIGATVAFLDEKVTRDTLIHYIQEFNSPLVVGFQKNKKWINELKKDAKCVRFVMNLDGELIRQGDVDEEQTEIIEMSVLDHMTIGRKTVRQLAGEFRGILPWTCFGGKREALISFTSGSTSGPKPMVFTNRNLIAAALFSKGASGIGMWDKEIKTWLSFVKFDCPYGFWTGAMTPIIGGASVILTPDIDAKNFDYYFAKNANSIGGVPLLLDMMKENLKPETDLSGLKIYSCGGERLEKSASEAAMEFFKGHGANVKMCNGYGVGEAMGVISVAVGSTFRPDTVGRVAPGVHMLLLDPETGEEVGFNRAGMLYIGGKHILRRYFNRPELDEDKIIVNRGEKFVKTGDLAVITETGFITLIGRATFFINTVPAKVYYEVVRAAVSRSEKVAKCYVVKMPDKKLGWAACAFVVPKTGVGRNNETRRAIVKDATEAFYLGRRKMELKNYELPRKVVFLDELPVTRANKTDFRKLERMAKEFGEAKTEAEQGDKNKKQGKKSKKQGGK